MAADAPERKHGARFPLGFVVVERLRLGSQLARVTRRRQVRCVARRARTP